MIQSQFARMPQQHATQTNLLERVIAQILKQLERDFLKKGLAADALVHGYEGLSMNVLKSLGTGSSKKAVAFDLAISDLEKAKLIDFGPKYYPTSDPDDEIIFIGQLSKREYVCLTQEGMKACLELRGGKTPKIKSVTPLSAPKVPNLVINGGTFNNSNVAAGEHVAQSISVDWQNQDEVRDYIVRLLEQDGRKVTSEERQLAAQLVDQMHGDTSVRQLEPIYSRLFGTASVAVQQVALNLLSSWLFSVLTQSPSPHH